MCRQELWASGTAEVGLLTLAMFVFLVNPTPFPYNLVLLVPFAYIACVRVLERHPIQPEMGVVTVVILASIHMGLFFLAVSRHLHWSNDRQVELMQVAEDLTDPEVDRVAAHPPRLPAASQLDPV